MKFEREYVDGNGRRFKATITILDNAAERCKLEKALLALAARARDNMRGRTNALGGSIHCVVHPDSTALATSAPIRERVATETCPENPGGPHSFTPDLEYDSTGQTINCALCGESAS